MQCAPPLARCPGGSVSSCGPGFADFLCESCTTGYYRLGRDCVSCESSAFGIALLVVAVVLFVGGIVFVIKLPYSVKVYGAWGLLVRATHRTPAQAQSPICVESNKLTGWLRGGHACVCL